MWGMRETEKAKVTVVFCLLISTTKKVELTFTEMEENVKGEDVGGIKYRYIVFGHVQF